MRKIFLIIVGLVVLGLAYWLLSPFWRNVELNEELPGTSSESIEVEEAIPSEAAEANIISQASLIAQAHEVQGQALLVQSGEETFLRFENLETINGPDLRIYLSADLNADDFIDLGAIRATEGNVNYSIPVGTDLTKYKKALIWCRAFGVLFSYAEL